MCIICVDLQRERMTWREAERALGEMIVTLDADHVTEVRENIAKAKQDQDDPNKTP